MMRKDTAFRPLWRGVVICLCAATMFSCAPPPRPGPTAAEGDRVAPAPPARPRIAAGTLVGGDGRRLRGGTFWLYGWIPGKTAWALSDPPWEAMRDYRLNVVRLACAYRPERAQTYTLDRYEALLDRLIDRAEAAGVYVILDYHPRPGSYDMDAATAFWSRFAPRYKDRAHMIYELINEPVFSQPDDYTDRTLRDFETLWRLVDTLAPQTPTIIMTFCQVGNAGRTPRQVVDELRGIDWSKTAVGFHSYWRDSSERIVDLMRHYPCMNTEFYTLRPNSRRREMQAMDGYAHHGTLMEALGISWAHWRILDTAGSLGQLDAVIADLQAHDRYWADRH